MRKSIAVINFIIVLFILTILGNSTTAQNNANDKSFGISALVQEGQFDIMLPFLVSQSAVIAPAIGLAYVSDAGLDIGLGIVGRFYLKNDVVRPFLGGRIGLLLFSPKESGSGQGESKNTTDYLLGILAGGEYFLDEGFSIGVEAQLNATFSDKNSGRFGNPDGTNLNTGAAVFATVYF